MAILFDAVDDLVQITQSASINNLGAMTISAWVKANSNGLSSNGVILAKGNGESGRWQFRLNATGNGQLTFFKNGATNLQTVSTTALSFGTKYHVLMTWDGSVTATNVHIYINGVEVSYGTQTNGVTLNSDGAIDMAIGSRAATAVNTFDGTIEELALWNIVLSGANITTLYNSGTISKGLPQTISASNLKGYWPMDDQPDGTSADGDTVRDASGNGNNGVGNDGANNTGLTWKDTTFQVSAQALSLSLQSPIRQVSVLPSPLAGTFILVNPTPSGASTTTVNIPALSMTLNQPAPTREVRILPNAQSIALTLVSPSPTVLFLASALSAALSLQNSTRVVLLTPNALAATLSQPGPTPLIIAFPNAQAISLVLVNPTISTLSVTIVNVPALTMTATLVGLTKEVKVQAPAQALTAVQPTSTPANIIAPNALAMAMALVAPTKEVARPAPAQTIASVMGGATPTVIAKPSAFLLNFVLNNPNIAIAYDNTVLVSPLSMMLTLGGATPTQIYKVVRIFTHNKQPKLVNKINAIRRISKNNAHKNQTHSGML